LRVLQKKDLKTILLAITLLSVYNNSYSQELLGQKNTVEITQTWLFETTDFKEPERKELKVFDKKGRLIKDIEFGFQHNGNLELIGNITTYEFQKNKLISKKTYGNKESFKKNQVQFYSNYFYDKSKLNSINSNLVSYVYTYIKDKKLIEWTATDDHGSRTFFVKYDDQKNIIERGEYGNWVKKYERKKDTLKIIEYSFDFPKKGDTTKTYISEVYSKGKITYRKESGFGIQTKKYVYAGDGNLKFVFTRIFDESEENFKSELVYHPNGLIREISKYELKENSWILKQRTEFEIQGTVSILNKNEIKSTNEILINGNKNWLQQYL